MEVCAILSLSAGSHVWVLFQKTFRSVNILNPPAQAPFLSRQRIRCSVWEWSFSSLRKPDCHKWATRSHKLSVCTKCLTNAWRWGRRTLVLGAALKRWIVFLRRGEKFATLKTAQSQSVEFSLRLNSKQTQRSANIFFLTRISKKLLIKWNLLKAVWKCWKRKTRFYAKKVFAHLKFPWKCTRLK